MKTIVYAPRAEKALANMPEQISGRIEQSLERYVITGQGDIKLMKGRPLWRLRVGDYRVLFTQDLVVLDIMDIGHRKDIYE